MYHANTSQKKKLEWLNCQSRFQSKEYWQRSGGALDNDKSVSPSRHMIFNVYTPNNRTLKYMKQNNNGTQKRNRQIHNYSWNLNPCLSATDRTTRQKFCKDIEDLNNTINQQDIRSALYMNAAPNSGRTQFFHTPLIIHQDKIVSWVIVNKFKISE